MNALVILIPLISLSAEAALFDSIDSVDVLRQQSAQQNGTKESNRTPSSEKPAAVTDEAKPAAEKPATDSKAD